MNKTTLSLGNHQLPVYTLNTVVVGTGAAGYNAADRLYQYGQRDIAIITEGVGMGTSRNTGSDKQTYYKLTLSGSEPDSVGEMAGSLFAGGCVDGDHALCEAALSVGCFLRLTELGVLFPHNRYGEYIGYKTDHDPRQRATSVGPYTSRAMTERLQQAVEQKGVCCFDRHQVIRVLVEEGALVGLLCLNLQAKEGSSPFVVFHCKNVVYATGGPAGIYAESVYPRGQHGATGTAFAAGVVGKNLTEWQYGLASVQPRWNVSGTYMQVLPRLISTNREGGEEREFLYDFFEDEGELLSKLFLKGYQWPFDVRKLWEGSSIIDMLVYLETGKGRRVFLDFRQNPGGGALNFSALSPEARTYLEQAGACFGTPIERLAHMNAPAVEFYNDRGVDLAREPLEIALSAQHNNGGLDVDCWWQTNIKGLFAVGEAAATHGVYRPGGSALNAGQVGSQRAAQYIAARRTGSPEIPLEGGAKGAILEAVSQAEAALGGTLDTVNEVWQEATSRMSRLGGPIRSREGIREAAGAVTLLLENFSTRVRVVDPCRLYKVFNLWDLLVCQQVYLRAMEDYIEHGGKSRGSALYSDPSGQRPQKSLPESLSFCLEDGSRDGLVQEVCYRDGVCQFHWRPVRPIPTEDHFFENIWRDFRCNGNIL